MSDCLFCRIAKGEIPCKKAYEDDRILAFYDINPAAPVHVLVIPKKHIAGLDEIREEDEALVGRIFGVIRDLARELQLAQGFRVVSNCGENGGQTVPHLHFHLLGGRLMAWPPG